ncbi:sugar ABC transporter substrate-binding protein [Lachnoclostridium pacaense]|uniref:Sugar ABC transporter substrate-binding protein n=1 Tax=Enterocloster hominis (ex Hitch et al. 2024) TaxID=1917870 RepID=A0ABV1D842_9FIRM|nr:sugar ABC transporter substrate-binding protein [Lachnoclostridium pacaense]MCC2815818.1 sugar ABC transporter substrate-binding protein [Lachnoclostridium pacaense]
MKKQLLAGVLGAAMVLGSLTGCGSKPAETTAAPAAAPAGTAAPADTAAADTSAPADTEAAAEELVIGCTLQNLSEEFMTMLQGAMELQLKNYDNVKLIINDAESQSDKQASQLDSFVAQGVDAVIISPVDADALASAVKTVVDAGIPVITCSADVTGDQGQVWVGSSNENGGEIEMKYVAEKLGGKGKIAVLRGPLGAFAEQGRFAGYETVLKDYPDIEIVFDQTGNWQREEAMALIENLLTAGTELDAIVCQNDGMALGALEAVKAAGKKDQITITGIDAIVDALDSIKAGELDATCFQDAIGQGTNALDMAVKAARGETVERMDIPFELVTKDNVDGYYDRIKLPE